MLRQIYQKFAGDLYRNNIKQLTTLFDDNRKTGAFLDLGCNDGRLSLKFAERINPKEIYGIDLDPKKIVEVKKKNIHGLVHDLNVPLPYPDNKFDVISSNQVLEHIADIDMMFREMFRVLKPSGYAVISTPNLSALHNIFFILLGWTPPGLHLNKYHVGNHLYGQEAEGHIRLYNVRALKDLAKFYGFRTEKFVGNGCYIMPFKWFDNLVLRCFPRYASVLTIKIRKPK